MANVAVGKMIDSKSESHSGYGAGYGSVDRTTFECPCGEGTYVIERDNIPGFKDSSYWLNCSKCRKKYDFDPITGKISEKKE